MIWVELEILKGSKLPIAVSLIEQLPKDSTYGISEPNVDKYSIYGACRFIYCDQYTFVLYSCSTLQWRYHHKISQVDLVEAPSTSKCFIFAIPGQHWSISILLTARFLPEFSLILLSSSHNYTQTAICKWTFPTKIPSTFQIWKGFQFHPSLHEQKQIKTAPTDIQYTPLLPFPESCQNRKIPSKHPPHEKTSSMQVAKHNTEEETAPHYLASFDNKKFQLSRTFAKLSCVNRIDMDSYCWWTKSCTSWYGKYPIIYRVSYIPGGAGYQLSHGKPLLFRWIFPTANRKQEVSWGIGVVRIGW